MSREAWRLLLALQSLALFSGFGSTLYVDWQSTSPTPPFTNWATAAVQIQDAVDAATAGDEVIVADGSYSTGGRTVYGLLTNRVVVDKPLSVRSLNGPAVTLICGAQTTNITGDEAVRCVYLTNGAILSGFTLTNGATRSVGDHASEVSGGGVWCESQDAILNNCFVTGSVAFSSGGGAFSGTLQSCTLFGNRSQTGGGAHTSLLNSCLVTSNTASFTGGGLNSCSADDCVIHGNNCNDKGGGGYSSYLTNCFLVNNLASSGGGTSGGAAHGCTITANSCTNDGGGAWAGILVLCNLSGNVSGGNGGGTAHANVYGCVVVSNRAAGFGGGLFYGPARSCTIVGNTAAFGGGTSDVTLQNSINYYNFGTHSGTNYYSGSLQFCCCWPRNISTGNFTNPPAFVDLARGDLHLQSNSPCINAGRNSFGYTEVDMDANPRVVGGTIDLGAYEYSNPQSLISYAWLKSYGFPTDGSADHADPDGDGLDNWSEWRCGTVPTNSLSSLRVISALPDGTNLVVTWTSVAGMKYFVQRCTNLAESVFQTRITNVVGGEGTWSYIDRRATAISPLFYRVGVGDQ